MISIQCAYYPISGVPYLAKLHFASAATANGDYLGLRECSEVVHAAVLTHARRVVCSSRQVRVYV